MKKIRSDNLMPIPQQSSRISTMAAWNRSGASMMHLKRMYKNHPEVILSSLMIDRAGHLISRANSCNVIAVLQTSLQSCLSVFEQSSQLLVISSPEVTDGARQAAHLPFNLEWHTLSTESMSLVNLSTVATL